MKTTRRKPLLTVKAMDFIAAAAFIVLSVIYFKATWLSGCAGGCALVFFFLGLSGERE